MEAVLPFIRPPGNFVGAFLVDTVIKVALVAFRDRPKGSSISHKVKSCTTENSPSSYTTSK